MKKQTIALSVRLATPGEVGLIQYAFERVNMMTFGANLPCAYFICLAGGQPFAGFQVYWGHAPEGTAGLASVAFHSVPGFPASWHGMFRGRHPGVELLGKLTAILPKAVHRLEVLPRASDRLSCVALERAGFKLEGTLRKWYPWRDELVDASMFSWIRESRTEGV